MAQDQNNLSCVTHNFNFQSGYVAETAVIPSRTELRDNDFVVGTKRAFAQMQLGIKSEDQEPIYKARKTNIATAEEIQSLVLSLNQRITQQDQKITSLQKAFVKEKLQRKLETEILNISLEYFTEISFKQSANKSPSRHENSMGRIEDIITNVRQKKVLIPGLEEEWLKALVKALDLSKEKEWSNPKDLINHWRSAGQNSWVLKGVCKAFSLEEESIENLFQ